MIRSRSAFAFILASALCAPASAQVYEGRLTGANISPVPQITLGALGAQLVTGMPGITGGLRATLAPSLSASVLAAPQVVLKLAPVPILPQTPVITAAPVLTPAAPQAAAPSMKVSAVADAVAPSLQALQAPDLKGEDAASAAERAMSPVLGEAQESLPLSVSEPATGKGPSSLQAQGVLRSPEGIKLRGSPLLRKVGFAPEVSAQHQNLLLETLTRRKAGWARGLAAMGVKLDGPTAPVITVRAARDTAKGAKVEYTFDWMQSETHVGSFKAYVTVKNLNPELRRGAAPEPAKERQIRMRFKKTVLAYVGGLNVESQVTDADIAAYLEAKGLRILSKGWDGYYTVAVTGQDQADSVARDISGAGIVLYATPVAFTVPEANQVRIVFKKSTVRSFGGLNVETSVSETEIGELLRAQGLRVLAIDRDGLYTVGAQDLQAAAMAGQLQNDAGVLYAKPVKFDPPAASMLIIQLREKYVVSVGGINIENAVSEDDVSSLLRRHGLMLVKILNNGAYKAARVSDATPGKDLVSAIAQEPIVKEAMALGGVTDEHIQSAAKGVASYKGRPWSSTEYNMAYGTTYWSLEERGATPEQLKLFEKLCDEAPVRGGGFNPWSGD